MFIEYYQIIVTNCSHRKHSKTDMYNHLIFVHGLRICSADMFDTNIYSKRVYLSIGEAMNTFLNDNWRHVAQEFKPILEETIGDLFKKFANKLYHKYPMDEILPI